MAMIKVGGVPEHFNTPWHWQEGKSHFAKAGLDIEWHSFPGGTGAMNQALRSNEIDIAVVLTEGIIADIAKGNPSKLIKFFVSTPLIWGVHVPSSSQITKTSQLQKETFAISRKGSGSQLMVNIMADNLNWDLGKLRFEEVGNIEGARKALNQQSANGFLWEKFTTQPYVDSGEFRRVGEVPTPWPCFTLAATESFIKECPSELLNLCKALNASCISLINSSERTEVIAQHAQLKPENITEWLKITQWDTGMSIDTQTIAEVIQALQKSNVLPKDQLFSPQEMIHQIGIN